MWILTAKFELEGINWIVDGGYGDNEASTVIDISDGNVEVIREGKGSLDIL